MGLREAFIDRVVSRVDRATQAKLHWRARLRAGDPHALLMQRLVEPGDTALDIGANWGLYATGLSELAGPDGHVVAVEPGPELRSLRAACSRRRNVTIWPVALSDRTGSATMHVPRQGSRSFSALARLGRGADGAEAFEVELARLDDLEVPRPERLRFIKCDVEGHEDAVLRGGESLIRTQMPALLVEIEERHRDEPVARAFSTLESWGYGGFCLTAGGLQPLDGFDLSRDQRAHLVAGELPEVLPAAYVNDFLFLPSGEGRATALDGLWA